MHAQTIIDIVIRHGEFGFVEPPEFLEEASAGQHARGGYCDDISGDARIDVCALVAGQPAEKCQPVKQRPSDADTTVLDAPVAADLTLRGTASDLDLVLWRRIAPDAVELEGDRTVLDGLLDVVII